MARWRVIEQIPANYPASAGFQLLTPESRLWPDFLKRTNLLAIVDRIVVIAVIAIGMTMVIVTGGIDLSVGSLIALSAVIATLVMQQLGGPAASAWVVLLGFLAGTLACGVVGGVGGLIVARFKVAPFITTLAVMMMARGLAFLITGGFSIYQVPAGVDLARARSVTGDSQHRDSAGGALRRRACLHVPHASGTLHLRRRRQRGGGSPVRRPRATFVIVFVYIVSALSAGLGGCIQASQINTGTPNMGVMYELYVIAAVVVGGTSLAGGSGRILGTLIGAFIISVIQNGMNLLGMESYTQQVVLGGVILGAVLLDKVRSGRSLTGFLQKSCIVCTTEKLRPCSLNRKHA